MARPRKGTQATWYDVFQEWSAEDRASAIKVLEQIHRFLLKHEQAKPATSRAIAPQGSS